MRVGLGIDSALETQELSGTSPKPEQPSNTSEAADAGHIDGSRLALAGNEEAQTVPYHAPAENDKAGPAVTTRIDGWKWAKAVRASSELTDGDKVVAWDLLDRLNWTTLRLDPAAETVARGTGRRARAVQRSILALAAEGFLKKAEASAGRKTNAYSLHFPVADPGSTASDRTGLAEDVHASTSSDRTRLNARLGGGTTSGKAPNPVQADTQTLENPLCPTPKAPSRHDGFDQLWDIWGRHEDRGKARQQWERIRRRLGVAPDVIVEAARAYRLERIGKGRDAWEPLALWLRREGFADDEPRKPPAPARAAVQVFLEEGSEGLRAWDEHRRQTTGQRSGYPRTCHQGRDGWWFPTPFPPSIDKRAA